MRHQIFALVGGAHVVALFAFGCSFPDYVLLQPEASNGGGGSGGAGSGGGGGASVSPLGGAGSHPVGGSTGAPGAGESGAGAPGAGTSGANPVGNDGGGAGQGGEGGAPPVAPKKCADYPALPIDAVCFDDATHAYLFRSETKSFSIAAAQCTFYEMHLASIETPVEDTFIIQSAAKIDGPSRFGYFWIGGTTLGSHGTWRWTDGSAFWTGDAKGKPYGDAYFNWRTGSPMNPDADSCVFSDGPGWQDGDCTLDRPYVCEAD